MGLSRPIPTVFNPSPESTSFMESFFCESRSAGGDAPGLNYFFAAAAGRVETRRERERAPPESSPSGPVLSLVAAQAWKPSFAISKLAHELVCCYFGAQHSASPA